MPLSNETQDSDLCGSQSDSSLGLASTRCAWNCHIIHPFRCSAACLVVSTAASAFEMVPDIFLKTHPSLEAFVRFKNRQISAPMDDRHSELQSSRAVEKSGGKAPKNSSFMSSARSGSPRLMRSLPNRLDWAFPLPGSQKVDVLCDGQLWSLEHFCPSTWPACEEPRGAVGNPRSIAFLCLTEKCLKLGGFHQGHTASSESSPSQPGPHAARSLPARESHGVKFCNADLEIVSQ